MNKTKKLICLAVLTVLLLSSVIALAACGGNAKETIESYMPSFSGKSVKDDFELPRTIGDNVKVSWKSSNPNAIEVVTRGKNETYLAKVKLGDTVQTVTLTVSAGGASKDFTVNVQALNATLIASEYEFKYNRAEVSEDFDLPATAEVRGVTAQITWSVDPKYSEYIEVKDGRCVITLPSETTRVEINATFSYNNTTATMPYTFYVAQPKSHRESVNAWYQSANVTLAEVRGYVVGIATAYNDNFNNISMYIVDEDMCSGYYLFRCKGSAEDAAKLAVGVHVTITSLTSSDFNGLMESTSDCTFVVDDDLPAKDVKDLVYALDNDATSGSPALKWHTGALASLTNWTVKSVESSFSSKSGTMMTITKDGADIAIAYNNYMDGFYTSTDNQPAATQFNLSRFKVGDTVSVTGIVSYHSGFQVMPRNADDIKTGTADTNPTDGSKVKAAITEVEGKLTGIDGLITTARTFDLPTASNGVNITYTKTYNGSSVSIEGGKITVTPQDKLQIITVEAEYKIGNYTTWTYFTLRSQNLDDQGKVNYVKGLFEAEILDEVTKTGDVTLPSNNEFDGLTVSWSVKGGAPDWLAISGNKLTINQLPTEDTTLTLVADISLNGKTAQAEVTLQVAAGQTAVVFTPITEAKTGTYKFGMLRDEWLYATGGMDGYYLATTTNYEEAADFVISGNETDGYTITANGKYLEIIPRTDGSKGVNVVFNATQTEGKVWKWNDTIKSFTMVTTFNDTDDPAKTDEYFLGTQSNKTYKTISATYISNASSNVIAVYGQLVAGGSTTPGGGDEGGGEEPAHPATCESACPICGKCKNADCTEDVCKEKCTTDHRATTTVDPGDASVVATFDFGDKGDANHKDGSGITDGESETFTDGDYTLTIEDCSKVYKNAFDAKGNSCLKLGTGKVTASFTFTVGDDVDYVKIYIGKYKANSTVIVINGVRYDLTKNSNDGEYDVIVIDTTETKTITISTVDDPASSGFDGRAMVDKIEFLKKNA